MGAISISTADLKRSVLRHCGEVDDGTSVYDQNGQILDYLNKAHAAILGGGNEFDFELSKPWSWAVKKDPAVLVLQPPVQGTVTVTNGQAAITFYSAPSKSLQDYRLSIDGRPDFMRISSHKAGDATATLDAPYADATAAAVPFTAILLDYKLLPTQNGILRLVQAMTVHQPQDLMGDEEGKIYFLDENQMDRDFPIRQMKLGTPNYFTITSKDGSGAYYIRFNKSVAAQTRVEYKFIEIPDKLTDSTSSFPKIPVEHRDALDFAASYFLCLDKNDDRATMFLQLTQQKLKGMLKAEEKQKTQTSKTRGKLIARLDMYGRGKRYTPQEIS